MLRKALIFAVISLLIPFGIALALIVSDRPVEVIGGEGLDFTQTLQETAQAPIEQSSAEMRDGYRLQLRDYPSTGKDAPLVVMVHGSGWHGQQFDALARRLALIAHVVVPDLRGHGEMPGVRGDISYIGQFEDDLADLITTHQQPGQKVVLVGHSSGGGLVVRFAGGPHGKKADAAVLLAPFLKHNAPTTRSNSGGWARPMLRRIVGLSMLNMAHIRVLNHLKIIQFNMPKTVLNGPQGHTATTAYSFRLNTSFAPRARYLSDVEALPRFMLIVGAKDEAFFAERYEQTMSSVTDKGRYVIVPDTGHLDIVDASETAQTIEGFLNDI